MEIVGCATSEGTRRYKERLSGKTVPENYKEQLGLSISSIGLGTYLGNHDDLTDKKYLDSIVRALELGCNVIDTAINYRFQRSERSIGRALKTLIDQGTLKRDEFIISTKGGFIPGDMEPPHNFISYFDDTFVKTGIATQEDLVMGCHCMTPQYIQNQLDTSLNNLGLDCIDIYYLHNPETQLEEVNQKDFFDRIQKAFEVLEKNVANGKIQYYGTATWNGYRVPEDLPDHLELAKLLDIAEQVGGKDHHFKVIQLPVNLTMPEALIDPTQFLHGKQVPILTSAEQNGITVMASVSMMQGQLSRNLPAHLVTLFHGLSTDAQRSIQFVRSLPGLCTALVGMSHVLHVEENMQTANIPPMSHKELMEFFLEKS